MFRGESECPPLVVANSREAVAEIEVTYAILSKITGPRAIIQKDRR